MSITNIKATQMGAHAHRYLFSKSRTGDVVSAFRNGFNILFDEASNPGCVSFQTEEVPLHPWAIAAEAIVEVRADALARAEANRIQFSPCDVIIDLSDANVAELKIKPWTQEEGHRTQKRIPMVERFVAKELAARVPDSFQPQIDAILDQWMKNGGSDELLVLVGLGSGSTPGGDDVLVGILAGLSALRDLSYRADRQLSRLHSTIHMEELQKTTPRPSAQMVIAALEGSFPEPLCDLAIQLKQANATHASILRCIKHVSSQGVTSGPSFLLGFMSAQVHPRHQE